MNQKTIPLPISVAHPAGRYLTVSIPNYILYEGKEYCRTDDGSEDPSHAHYEQRLWPAHVPRTK